MVQCKGCGTPIDNQQAVNFNGLCPGCVRILKSAGPIRTIAKKQSDEWLGMVVLGVMICLVSLVAYLIDVEGRERGGIFITGLGFFIGAGLVFFGFIMYRGSRISNRRHQQLLSHLD